MNDPILENKPHRTGNKKADKQQLLNAYKF